MSAYTPYEQSARAELDLAFTSPFRTPVSALVHAVGPVRRRAGRHLRALVKIALLHVDDLAAGTLARHAVLQAFVRAGHRQVKTLADVRRLDLWEADEVANKIQAKYLAGGAVLGAFAGASGPMGALADVPLVTVLALRAIGEYALHYGFDPRAPKERAFAVDILAAALSPTSNIQSASVEELVDAGSSLARAFNREKGARVALPILFEVGRSIFRRVLTRPRRRLITKVGAGLSALVSAGANAWLLFGVTRAARSAYRERRLE